MLTIRKYGLRASGNRRYISTERFHLEKAHYALEQLFCNWIFTLSGK